MAAYQLNQETFQVRRIQSGYYEMTRKGSNRVVSINYFCPAEGATFTGWVARADWRTDTYTDPLETYSDAKFNAAHMLLPQQV